MDKEDLKYVNAGILGCSDDDLTEDLSQEVDSEGNPLTKEQVEFFKNSKVRDSQGRLLVCYHGSDADRFNVFDHSFISDDNKSGYGFYFTLGTKLEFNYISEYACYINLTNPLTDMKTIGRYVRDGEYLRIKGFTQKEIIDKLSKKYKCDGIINPERGVIAFYSNQIKSIDNKTPSNSNNINEDLKYKTFTFPNLKQAIDFFWKDRDANIETVPIKKLVYDNDLLNDEDLQSYHQRQWDNKKANEFSIDKNKAKMWRVSEVPYAVRKKDGKLELGDGRHRTRALYNDGYEYVTLPVITESISKTTPRIRESLLQESKQDIEKFITWAGDTLANKFYKYKQRLKSPENDIYYWMSLRPKEDAIHKLENVLNTIESTPTRKAKFEGAEYETIYNDGVWKVILINNVQAARKFGQGTTWCIRGRGEDAEMYYYNYINNEYSDKFDWRTPSEFYFYIPKDDRDKFCLKLTTSEDFELYDAQDYIVLKVDDGGISNESKWLYQPPVSRVVFPEVKGLPNLNMYIYDIVKKTSKSSQGTDEDISQDRDDEMKVNTILTEGRQDKENFKKWAEQAVEIAYKDRGLSDWERKGNAEYIVNWFENNRKNLKSPQNDYYYWIKEKNVQGAYDELNRLAVEQEKKKDSEKKSKDGARLIYSDSNWKVYEITTYEASVKYGANTKWCISGSKRWSNGAYGRGYWEDYTSKGVKFYFFIGKGTKYAIAIYPNGTDFEIFDAQDNSIAYIPNAPIIDEIKVDYYSHNEDRLMLNLIKTGQLPHICPLLSQYLWESNYSTTIYDKNNFDNFLQEIRDNVNEDYVKWLAVYNGLKDEEWYEKETGEEYEDEWGGDTTYYLQADLGFLDNYATLDDALTKDNPYFDYDNNEYFISDLYDGDIDCCKDWAAVWLYLHNYLDDEIDLLNFIKDEISTNWGYSDFEKVGLSKEYLLGETDLDESLDDFDDEVGKVYHGGIEKSLHKDFRSILWFTEDYDYALDFGENIFICNLNLKNTFIVGNTDGYIRGLIPTQFSTDFIRLANNLKVTPKELLKCNPEASKIYSIVRTKAFKELCIKNGYDSVETEEFGHVCFGVFNLDQVDIVDTDFEDESTLETLSPMDESLKPNLREELLLEKGTDYKKQAVKIISNSGLFDEETSTKIIDGLFRQDIHAFNHAPAWLEKYLKGIARMLVEYCDGDKSKAQQFLTECPSEFEYYLTWVKQNREKIGNSLDDEFVNNLTYEQVKEKNNKIRDEIDAKSKDELSKMKFSNNSNYTLVPIDSYEQMHKLYGGHWTGDGTDEEGEYAGNDGTSWCHTNSKNTYDTWTRGGYRFFVLQRNNWKDIPFNKKTNEEMSGKDDYGNSLIAILVNKYGKLNNATLRCNHVGISGSADNQYNSYAELSKIAGFNIEEEILKYDFEEFSMDKLFTVREGVLIRIGDISLYKEITEYTVPNGTIEIGDAAFDSCSNLTSIKIPNSVTSIRYSAFKGCSSLTSIEIPNSVESIGEYAFYDCSSLTSVTVGEGSQLTIIGSSAFSGCSNLTSIKIPSSVTSIGSYAFYKCSSLKSIEIPASVTSIGKYAFYYCKNITSITFQEGSKLTSINAYAFSDCSSLTSIEIPSSVTSIGDAAFDSCSNLTSIKIPNSVTSIGAQAFSRRSHNLTVFTDNDYVKRYCKENEINCVSLS